MIEPTVLKDGDRPTHVILAWEDWERLREALEDAEDAAEARQILADPTQDWVPAELVERMLDEGVHPVQAWREHRVMTQTALATTSGVPQPTLTQIESGERRGTPAQMKKLARALGIGLETLTATMDG